MRLKRHRLDIEHGAYKGAPVGNRIGLKQRHLSGIEQGAARGSLGGIEQGPDRGAPMWNRTVCTQRGQVGNRTGCRLRGINVEENSVHTEGPSGE